MKKLLISALTLIITGPLFAQGTVFFNMRLSGTAHVYAPLNPSDTIRIIGQGNGDGVPTGSTDYGGRAFIGANGTGGQWGAATTLAQLLGGPAGSPESSLLPSLSAPTSFRTGTAAGGNAPTTATFNNIAADAAIASFEVVAWDNSSGLYPTYALARPAWQSGLILFGISSEFSLRNIGGSVNTPPPLFPTLGDTTPGLQSFSIFWIPEPTTIALAALGAGTLLALRRRE